MKEKKGLKVSTELPASITIHARDKCSHGFISTPSLQLKVRGFPLPTFTAPELICGCHILQPSLAFKQRFLSNTLVLLFPCIARHVISSHIDNFFRLDVSEQNTSPKIWVLIILEVEHNGPVQKSKPAISSAKICTYKEITNISISKIPH